MKEELLLKIITLHETLESLNETWNKIDWSIVPDSVSENYPFYEDLETMRNSVKVWIKIIEKS